MNEQQQQAIAKYQKIDPRPYLIDWDIPEATIEKVCRYHRENPSVWLHFEQYALQAYRRGATKIGSKLIMERVRWESEIEQGEPWKCDNSYSSYYARLFASVHTQAKDMFEFRTIKGLKR